MAKKLDLNLSVYELVQQYPELIEIMAEMGFSEITKPVMLNTMGRMMTIPKGAKVKEIPMMKVVATLLDKGFELTGEMPPIKMGEELDTSVETAAVANGENERTVALKDFLKRLGAGEDLESVRADFVQQFRSVDASEIMQAEQELMAEGTPLEAVQRLCDVHSALFHGATAEEAHAAAAEDAEEAAKRERREQAMKIIAEQQAAINGNYDNKKERAGALAAIQGHPLYTFSKENEALAPLLQQAQSMLARSEDIGKEFEKLREVSIHYAKKGDLLYPLLKVRYAVTGPSSVMWTVDDEIRDEMGKLAKLSVRDEAWRERAQKVLTRAEEMIYKETNILFPICAVNFTEEEWHGIYHDSKDYAQCFDVENGVWAEVEENKHVPAPSDGRYAGEIVMPGGHMTVEQMTAMLNTIPLEISFIDDNNINRYFNEGPKVFKRPVMAIDRDVFSCHPPKIEPIVRQIIDSFRNGTVDVVPVWMEKGGRLMLVRYMAVRDRQGKYLGTLEVVEDMEFAKKYFQDKL